MSYFNGGGVRIMTLRKLNKIKGFLSNLESLFFLEAGKVKAKGVEII
jgi:hypothetical protein